MYTSQLKKCARLFACGLLGVLTLSSALYAAENGEKDKDDHKKPQRNVIIFVADGLRPGSVNATDAPVMTQLRALGVNFVNSHAFFPTFTTANASAIATGHQLGDTGDFSNTIYGGYPIFNTGNFGNNPGTVTPFVENSQILGDLNDHYFGNYLNEESLLSLARAKGYATAAIGKVGPVAIQDVKQVSPVGKAFQIPSTVIIDDRTGSSTGVPLSAGVASALTASGLGTVAPGRGANGVSGTNTTPGTLVANVIQQQYFADALTKAVLPTFIAGKQPFVVVYWSRDPDGTQHNQGDSLNTLTPGINGPTSRAGVHDADSNLGQILAFLKANKIDKNTDIFVTADHGFSTISRHDLDASGTKFVNDFASKQTYPGVNAGFLPVGFLAIDIAHQFNLPLFDPDQNTYDATTKTLTFTAIDATAGKRPAAGDGLIGGTGIIVNPATNGTDAKIVVAANGGSDLIYVPSHDEDTVRKLVRFLTTQEYVGGLFVDDSYGQVAGALPFSSIGLHGSAVTPTPAIAVNFRSFSTNPTDNLNFRVEFADTGLQQGQGMHGNFSRADTFNNMLAYGPDFRVGFKDPAPVSNADVPLTLAHILDLDVPSNGRLAGRVIKEALKGGEDEYEVPEFEHKTLVSRSENDVQTVLQYQTLGRYKYFDAACFADVESERDARKACK